MTASQTTERIGGPEISRRGFMQLLGAGVVVTVTGGVATARRRPSGGSRSMPVAARIHIGADGTITVLTGKVEVGQGSRAQLTQAAAEELRVPVDRINLIMGDTALVPDDGVTAGSRTTPSTVPAVRQGAAAARKLLEELACRQWQVKPSDVRVRDGVISDTAGKRKLTYADLAKTPDLAEAFKRSIPSDVAVTPVQQWQVLGTSVPRPNLRNLVTGEHKFPSDIARPGMLYGKVLRPPSFGAQLQEIDLAAAKPFGDVVVVRDGDFVGCAAPTSQAAQEALDALARTARWKPAPHPSSSKLFSYLKEHAQGAGPSARTRDALANAAKALRQTYTLPYVQHVPMEPRAAVAEWADGKLTVWTGSQAPNRVHSELARAFGIGSDRVRVIIPDTGGGFGGKHSGESAVEAARLARGAKRPVSLRWTRREEFIWAYFRPAAVIEVQGGLDADGKLVAWDFVNINAGSAGVGCPYDVANLSARSVRSDGPLREGSYRCLAATGSNFAREGFMDELAAAAGADPLAFRVRHLGGNTRLRAVLEEAAKRFGWEQHRKQRRPGIGVGLACGTEKASFVAACVEVAVDRKAGTIDVKRVCEVFECGAVQNPDNMRRQVIGCIVMGLGPALREEVRFEDGKVLTNSFGNYPVPRFRDVPELDVHLLDRRDLPSVGGGETPIIAIAPAIANAVFDAVGVRVRSLPIRLPAENA